MSIHFEFDAKRVKFWVDTPHGEMRWRDDGHGDEEQYWHEFDPTFASPLADVDRFVINYLTGPQGPVGPQGAIGAMGAGFDEFQRGMLPGARIQPRDLGDRLAKELDSIRNNLDEARVKLGLIQPPPEEHQA